MGVKTGAGTASTELKSAPREQHEAQALQSLHRVRSVWMATRTARIAQLERELTAAARATSVARIRWLSTCHPGTRYGCRANHLPVPPMRLSLVAYNAQTIQLRPRSLAS